MAGRRLLCTLRPCPRYPSEKPPGLPQAGPALPSTLTTTSLSPSVMFYIQGCPEGGDHALSSSAQCHWLRAHGPWTPSLVQELTSPHAAGGRQLAGSSGSHLQENFGLPHFPVFVCPQPHVSDAQGHLAELALQLPRPNGGIGGRWGRDPSAALWGWCLPPPTGSPIRGCPPPPPRHRHNGNLE